MQLTDALGNRLAYTLDAAGRRLSETVYDAQGVVVRTGSARYDVAGRVLEERDASAAPVASYSYDAAGNRLTHTDALGATTRYAYGFLGRLTHEQDPLGAQVAYGYDAADRLVQRGGPEGLDRDLSFLDGEPPVQGYPRGRRSPLQGGAKPSLGSRPGPVSSPFASRANGSGSAL